MDDRRRHPRFELEPALPGTTADGTRVTLLDISSAGCLVHAQRAVAPGDREVLRFHFAPEIGGVDVPARAVHATAVPSVFRSSQLVGFEIPSESSQQLKTAIRNLNARASKAGR